MSKKEEKDMIADLMSGMSIPDIKEKYKLEPSEVKEIKEEAKSKEEEEKEEVKKKGGKHGTKGKKSKKKGRGGGATVGSKGGGAVRCYMRYGNQGQLYRICAGPPPPTTKPPAVFVPLISPVQFVEKLAKKDKSIKSYGDLSSSQKQNYHRLAQAQSRAERRANRDLNNDQYTLYLEGKRMDAQIDRIEDKLEKKKEKEERRITKNMEERGILASTDTEIEKYYNKVEEKAIKKLESAEERREFFEGKKEAIERDFEKDLKEDRDDRLNIWESILRERVVSKPEYKDGKRVGIIKGNFWEQVQTPFGAKPLKDVVKALGMNELKLMSNVEDKEGLNKLKGDIKKIFDNIPKFAGQKLAKNIKSLDDLKKVIKHKKLDEKALKPFYQMTKEQEDKLLNSYKKHLEQKKKDRIDRITNDYERIQKNEKKRIEEIRERDIKKAKAKRKVAVRDAEAKGMSGKWIKKNVKLLFDKDFSGEVKDAKTLADILMGVEKSVEKVAEIDEDLDKLQKKLAKSKKKRVKDLTKSQEAEEKRKAKAEEKELAKIKRTLAQIDKRRR